MHQFTPGDPDRCGECGRPTFTKPCAMCAAEEWEGRARDQIARSDALEAARTFDLEDLTG